MMRYAGGWPRLRWELRALPARGKRSLDAFRMIALIAVCVDRACLVLDCVCVAVVPWRWTLSEAVENAQPGVVLCQGGAARVGGVLLARAGTWPVDAMHRSRYES
jgi:hypothetical protein